MTDRPPLAVWLYGTQVATLADAGGDRMQVTWTDDATARWGLNSRVVSNLLPVGRPSAVPNQARVKAFVDGLLPEGHARSNHAIEAGLRPDDSFGLLATYGRDTAGALVFQPLDEAEPVRVGTYRDMDDAEVAHRLREADKHSPARTDGRLRDSSTLAGMQPKITAHRSGNRWQACLDGAPSTWIIKLAHPSDARAADVIDTEVLSLDLVRSIGLAAAEAEIVTFDGIRTIAVRRYDRRVDDAGNVTRIHQEDLAQAIGLDTSDPLRKFQRGNAMPSLVQAATVLRDGGSEPDDLLRLMTVNYLLGNIDAHAKNISFLRHDDGTATLAPAYDIAMHLHHLNQRHRSALDINGKIDYADMTGEDLVAEGDTWAMPPRRVPSLVADTVRALSTPLQEINIAVYPGVSARALEVVRERARRTLDEQIPRSLTTATGGPPLSGKAPPERRGPTRRRAPSRDD